MEAGADETGQRDDEYDEADDEEGQLEERLASGAAPRHPQSRSDQRDRHQQREQVQEPDYGVAETSHLSMTNLSLSLKPL